MCTEAIGQNGVRHLARREQIDTILTNSRTKQNNSCVAQELFQKKLFLGDDWKSDFGFIPFLGDYEKSDFGFHPWSLECFEYASKRNGDFL